MAARSQRGKTRTQQRRERPRYDGIPPEEMRAHLSDRLAKQQHQLLDLDLNREVIEGSEREDTEDQVAAIDKTIADVERAIDLTRKRLDMLPPPPEPEPEE